MMTQFAGAYMTLSSEAVSQVRISNCIPQHVVGCNYLSMPEIPALGAKVLIYSSLSLSDLEVYCAITCGNVCWENIGNNENKPWYFVSNILSYGFTSMTSSNYNVTGCGHGYVYNTNLVGWTRSSGIEQVRTENKEGKTTYDSRATLKTKSCQKANFRFKLRFKSER